jgi:flagellar biosynthesis protein FlhF
MRIRKFVAADMKDALAQIKRDLGSDALIVAARPIKRGLVGNGVEVTAAVDIDEGAPTQPTPLVSHSAALSAFQAMSGPATTTRDLAQHPHHPGPTRSLTDSDLERIMAPLRSELRSLRSQLRAIEPRNHDDEIKQQLRELRNGLALLRSAPNAANDHVIAEESLATVAANHKLTAPSKGRVIALVGPTGVGKTTTIAKLAARAALVEKRSVAIITLDDYRIGGEDQMRSFADLIGVPLTVCAVERLGQTLASMDHFEKIFIDTAGRSPRDTDAILALTHAFAGLTAPRGETSPCGRNEGLDIEIHLTLPAGSSRAAIDGAATRLAAMGIKRVLFTKVDEAEQLEELVRAPARLGLPLSYITTGQRVPEDLEDATPLRLVELATHGLSIANAEAA